MKSDEGQEHKPDLTFPEVETTRLWLTEIGASDVKNIFDLFSNQRVVEFYDLAAFTALSEAEKLIETLRARYQANLGIRWAIRLKSSGEFVGTCGFNSWTPPMRSALLGYDLGEPFWGKGFCSEALAAIISFAFSGGLHCSELNRIQADTVPGNVRSEAVLARLGFKEEGLRRECGFWKGGYHDLKCYGLLRRDFERAHVHEQVGLSFGTSRTN